MDLRNLLKLLHETEGLKRELRHSGFQKEDRKV